MAEERGLVLLDRVGIAGKALACPAQLSGGESQDAYISLTTNEPARARRLWPWRSPP